MDKENIKRLLALLKSHSINEGSEWVRASCPLATWKHEQGKDNNPSFGIKINDEGESFYNCYTCGSHGSLYDLIMDVRDFNLDDKHYDLDIETLMKIVNAEGEDELEDLPDFESAIAGNKEIIKLYPFSQLWWGSFYQDPNHWYLKERGITKKQAEYFDIKYDTVQQRIVFPIYDFDGVLRGAHGRLTYDSKDKNNLRYFSYASDGGNRNPSIWMNENNVDVNKPIVLSEGMFDMTAIHKVYKNVLAGLTASISVHKAARLAGVPRIVTFFDKGKGGDVGRERVDKLFDCDIEHVIPTTKKDAGEMTQDELYEHLEDYVDCY